MARPSPDRRRDDTVGTPISIFTAIAVVFLYLVPRLAASHRVAPAGCADHRHENHSVVPRAAYVGPAKRAVTPERWRSLTVVGLSFAEELLDEIEALGHEDRELIILDNSTFLVRWRRGKKSII